MNKIDLSNQVAIITGGASGFGLACAKRFLQSGARVSLWDMNTDALIATCRELGDGASFETVDITDYPAIVEAHARVEQTVAPVSILVNSAGISGPQGPMVEYELDAWAQVINVNLTGTFYINRAVLPAMIARNYGRIVNVSSVAGKEGNPNAAAYAASKAGVIAFVKAVGKEVANHDIAINAITPAVAKTKLLDTVPQEFQDYMLSKIPRGRFLEVEELSAMVAWLVSRENSFTTASVFDLSGGRSTY